MLFLLLACGHPLDPQEPRLSQVDHFDANAKFTEWEATLGRAARVEETLRGLDLEASEAPEACPEGTAPHGWVDLRDLRGEELGRLESWSSTDIKRHVGLPQPEGSQSTDLAFHQERYAYAKALNEGQVALVGVLETVAPQLGEGMSFEGGISRGGVWVVEGGAVICQAAFAATSSPEFTFDAASRNSLEEAVQGDLSRNSLAAMQRTYKELVYGDAAE